MTAAKVFAAAVIGLGMTLTAVPQASHATLVAYSGLDTTNSGLLGVSDGIGFGESWKVQNDVVFGLNAGSLAFGTLTTAGKSINGGNAFCNAWRGLATNYNNNFYNAGLVSDPWTAQRIDQGTLWFSALVKVNSSLPGWDPMKIAFANGLPPAGTGDIVITAAPNGTWTAQSTGGASASTGVTVTSGQTVLLVSKFNFTTGGFYLWAFNNPNAVTLGGADPAEGSAMAALTGLTVTNGMDFKNFLIYPGNSAGQVEMDEFRFGTTYADVTPFTPVPEPASVALLTAGGLLLIGRRRRA